MRKDNYPLCCFDKTASLQSSANIDDRYENMPMQYTDNFSAVKVENFTRKKKMIFLIFLLKTYIVGTCLNRLTGGSNEYPQCIFGSKI